MTKDDYKNEITKVDYNAEKSSKNKKHKYDEKYLKDAIEEFGQGLIEMPDDKAVKKIERAKKKLENIAKENNLDLDKVFSAFHDYSLDKLGSSMYFFYALRNSEGSRKLDYCVWLTKFLKVPKIRYVDTVLEYTPLNSLQKELEDQVEAKNITKEEVHLLIDKCNSEMKKNNKDKKYRLKYSRNIKKAFSEREQNITASEENPEKIIEPESERKSSFSGLLKRLFGGEK